MAIKMECVCVCVCLCIKVIYIMMKIYPILLSHFQNNAVHLFPDAA